MKNSLFILAFALVSLSNVCDAKSFAFDSKSASSAELASELSSKTKNVLAKPSVGASMQEFNPETLIAYRAKSAKEIIVEDDKITETIAPADLDFMEFEATMKELISVGDLIVENTDSKEVYPLFYERSMEDQIAELELIIESTVTEEAFSLDINNVDQHFDFTALPTNFVGME